jgi:hypothetical protein
MGYLLKTDTLTDMTDLTDIRLGLYREKSFRKIYFLKMIPITFSKYLSVLSYLSYCNNTLGKSLSKHFSNV